MTIPTYAADGRRLQNRRLAAIEQLLRDGLVIVHRTRKGAITCAQFLPAEGAAAVARSIPTGNSFLESLPSGRRAWKFASEPLEDETDQAEAEKFIRTVFYAVPLSIAGGCLPLLRPASRKRETKRSRRVSRPVEFDSQLRVQ